MKKCLNWNRIIAIGGLTFCTTLVSTGYQTVPAVINAGLIAGIALFTELKFESEGITKVQAIMSKGLVL